MDIQAYINSGVLEEYCLGLLSEEDQAYLIQMSILYPEIKDELIAVENALEQLAHAGAIEPSLSARDRILGMFGFNDTEETTTLQQLPPISKNADHRQWLNTYKHLIPVEPVEDMMMEVVRDDDQFRQMLVVSKLNIPEEEHGNFLESFLILDGRCECTIGGNLYQLGPGDFIEIPLNMMHDIRILTPHVTAVLQYEFI